MSTSVNIKIGGAAGEGIKTTGLILSKSLSRLGFSIFAYDEYPSLIRGGHNTYQVYAAHERVHSQYRLIDILVAYDLPTVTLHQNELKDSSLIILDTTKTSTPPVSKGKLLPIPLTALAQKAGGSPIMANMVSLGATLSLCGLPTTSLLDIISQVFADKGEEIILANQKAVQAGADYVKNNFADTNLNIDLPANKKEQIVILGNEAISVGALAAGMKYFASYPMTPTSNILHFLAEQAENYNLVVNHVENEIAAINTVIGASAAGVRAMTATSGGGFSLMVEGLGMGGMAEVPMVIVLGTRPGPSTGMPTWTGQGDLRFAIHAAQDEFPRVVLTPGDAFETFDLTKKAFILAEKYQMPVILLVDKYLCESHKSGSPFPSVHQNERYGFAQNLDQTYLRYRITEDGVSPRPLLGESGGASVMANSYEHGEDSLVTEEAGKRQKMQEKRLRKLESVTKDLGELPVFGKASATTTLVGFGSTYGPAQEALKELPEVNYLHFNYVWPFPVEQVTQVLEKAQRIVCLEGNKLGQLQGLIREQTGIEIKECLRKYDGRPFYPEEIASFMKK